MKKNNGNISSYVSEKLSSRFPEYTSEEIIVTEESRVIQRLVEYYYENGYKDIKEERLGDRGLFSELLATQSLNHVFSSFAPHLSAEMVHRKFDGIHEGSNPAKTADIVLRARDEEEEDRFIIMADATLATRRDKTKKVGNIRHYPTEEGNIPVFVVRINHKKWGVSFEQASIDIIEHGKVRIEQLPVNENNALALKFCDQLLMDIKKSRKRGVLPEDTLEAVDYFEQEFTSLRESLLKSLNFVPA